MSTPRSHEALASEARAALGRARLSVRSLAARTGRSHGYWSSRLSGAKAMTVEDVDTIAAHTGTSAVALIAAAERAA